MLCQVCGKKNANVHVKQIVNDVKTEMMLCEDCAQNLGVTSAIEEEFNSGFGDLFGSFFPSYVASPYRLDYSVSRCEKCGTSFEDVSSTGKLGCANCYKTFYDELLPYIKRIHGNTKHAGKVALCARACADNCKSKIEELQIKLKRAVENQEFEQAAVFRDEIKKLKDGGNCDE